MTKTTHLDMHEGSLLHKMKSNFCLLCQFLFNLFTQSFFVLLETDSAAVFARDPGWQQDCRGVEQLPAKIPDVPFNLPGSNSNWQNQVYDLEQDPCTTLCLHQTILGIALHFRASQKNCSVRMGSD